MYLCGECHIQWDTPYYDKKVWCDCGEIKQGDYLGVCEKLIDCPKCTNDDSYTTDIIAYPESD